MQVRLVVTLKFMCALTPTLIQTPGMQIGRTTHPVLKEYRQNFQGIFSPFSKHPVSLLTASP